MNDKRKVGGTTAQHQSPSAPASDTPHNHHRRRIIMALAAGAAVSIPARWTRPVINAVMLPAHAQATGQCATVILSGRTITCADVDPATWEYWRVDDESQPCPFAVRGDASNPFTVAIQWGFVPASGVVVGVEVGGVPVGGAAQNCFAPPAPNSDNVLSAQFLATSGVAWRAEFTLSRRADRVSVSDIVLTAV